MFARRIFSAHLNVFRRHSEQVPDADAVATIGPFSVARGDELHDSDGRTRAAAGEIPIRHEIGMIVDDGMKGAVKVQVVGSHGDHLVLTVERPAVVETVEPSVLRVLARVLALIRHAHQRLTTGGSGRREELGSGLALSHQTAQRVSNVGFPH